MSNLLQQVAGPQIKSTGIGSFFCPCGATKRYGNPICRRCIAMLRRPPIDLSEYVIDGIVCRRIPLTREQYATVEAIFYDDLMRHLWTANWNPRIKGFYAVRQIWVDGKPEQIAMHRLLLGVSDPEVQVDHRNGDTLFNIRTNLRPCTQAENNCNSKIQRTNNTSGYKGVHYSYRRKKWLGRVQHRGKVILAAACHTAIAAARARDKLAIKLHGKFAKLNFPNHD